MKKSKNKILLALLLLHVAILVSALYAEDDPSRREPPIPVDVNFPTQPRPGRFVEHLDQKRFLRMVKGDDDDGSPERSNSRRHPQQFDAMEFAREKGDDFFDNLFFADSVFGSGANVGQGQRYSRVPRADLRGPNEWANHVPLRATGPNAASCIECHTGVRHDGGGLASVNAIRDPLHTGDPASFVNRNTPHLFGQGALQRLAEEMTEELQLTLKNAKNQVCRTTSRETGGGERPGKVTRQLVAKGTAFGQITIYAKGCVVDTSQIEGIDKDLVVKPFQWKGSVAFIRDFNRGAAHNENGQQAVEIVGHDIDGDGDGVINEVSVGDMTALTVYVASQPRPTTKIELEKLGKIPPLSKKEILSIWRGRDLFKTVGCAQCHTPQMKLASSIFSEPSQSPYYRDKVFPAGQDPVNEGLDPKYPIQLDLTKDVINGFSNFQKDKDGMTKVELYSDLKRHDLGKENAESIDEAGTGTSVWITKPLWGVGSTVPYMHDGRATSISQAVESHGGEARGSRAAYKGLSNEERKDIDAFLNNLRIWKPVDIDS